MFESTFQKEVKSDISDSVWEILEDELERDLNLDLNDFDDSRKFKRIVRSITDAVYSAVEPYIDL